MNPVTWLNTFLPELVTNIEAIKSETKVIDDSTLTKRLNAHQTTKNYLAVGVLPDVNSKGNIMEELQPVLICQLMILKKTSYADVNYDQFWKIFEEAYDIAVLVLKYMQNKSTEGCEYLQFLNVQSIKIIPVWNLSSCNGCNILFSFDSRL